MNDRSAMPNIMPATACAGMILTMSSCMPVSENDLDQTPSAPSAFPLADVSFLDDDLIRVQARVALATKEDAATYAECAAAEAALAADYGYLRHIRTQLTHRSRQAMADAVYLISVKKPDGSEVLVASDVVSDCSDAGDAALRGEDG